MKSKKNHGMKELGKVSGKVYAEYKENEDKHNQNVDNHPARRATDIAQNLKRSEKYMGISRAVKVKAEGRKSMGRGR